MAEKTPPPISAEMLKNTAACYDPLLPILGINVGGNNAAPEHLAIYNEGVTLTNHLISMILAREQLGDAVALVKPSIRGSSAWAELIRRLKDIDKTIEQTSFQLHIFKKKNGIPD